MDFICRKLDFTVERANSLEWLETNGLGGYSSSTILNCHTRKYHALLVSKLDNFTGKYVTLNKVEDSFQLGDQEYFLASHLYPGVLHTEPIDLLQEFRLERGHPIWVFQFDQITLIREIMMVHNENTVLLKYRIIGGHDRGHIRIRPLFSLRNFHSLQRENLFASKCVETLDDGIAYLQYEGMPKLFLRTNVPHQFLADPQWYKNFIYIKEMVRGYDFTEDLFSPGTIIINMEHNREAIISCSLEQHKNDLPAIWSREFASREQWVDDLGMNDFQKKLHAAADKFIVRDNRSQLYSVVAGYHWFLEWGRDAMIALPGLTLYSGKEELCLSILKRFALCEKQGLIPNYLDNHQDEHTYNTVDASLWFAWALQQYYLKTNDLKKVITYFWTTLRNIFNFYKNGTLHNISMDTTTGLLYAGNPNINLTWMDAVVDGNPVTSRYGYQVEINALWFNLLGFMEELAKLTNDPLEKELHELGTLVRKSFCKTFWCEEHGYLYDFINGDEHNLLIRPNQLFAVSLPHSPLTIATALKVVEITREQLLTPYGLRTLSPGSMGYHGSYRGSQMARDLAYHNGTVWPWLLGHFTEALLRVTGNRKKVLQIIAPCWEALEKHLDESGLGSIAEVFSGNAPHDPEGCISQAWSVAEVLRSTYLLK